ncbi:uncharacterized protein LOC134772788 isoform X5 [Penaeus indicus]|uniref:uncharacterized protein LOC134772788 isoform X5 n=1 Tax=Penaeus indicus TaxID=29960 RepID=UPI00300D2AD0
MDTSPIPGGCSVAGCKSRDDLHHFPESEREKRSWSDFCQRDIANFRDTDYEAMEKLKKGSQPTQQPPGIKGKPATEKCSIEEFQRQLKRLKKEKNILLKRNRLWAKEMKEARKQMSDLRYHNELMAEERDKARKERDALQLEKRHLLKALEEERKEKEALVARKKQEGAELHVAVTESSEIPDCPSMEIPTVNVLNVKKENEMSHTQNHNEEMKEVESEDTDIEPKNEEEITIKEEEIECNDPLLTFPCKFCETVYATKYDLENHIREEHERGALLSCCSCEKMFHKDIELKLHEVVQHQAKLCKKEPLITAAIMSERQWNARIYDSDRESLRDSKDSGEFDADDPEEMNIGTKPLRLTERHFPSSLEATPRNLRPRRRCHVCAKTQLRHRKRQMTYWQCADCGIALCVPQCFRVYHTRVKY